MNFPERISFVKYGKVKFVAGLNPGNTYNFATPNGFIIKMNVPYNKVKNIIKKFDGKVELRNNTGGEINVGEFVAVLASCGNYKKDINWIAERFRQPIKVVKAKIRYLGSRGKEVPFNIQGCQR